MKIALSLFTVSTLACLAVNPSSAMGQTTALKLFGPVNVRSSANGTSSQNPVAFNSTTLSLSCPANSPIQALLSSSADGTGNVLVDNFLNVTVTYGTTTGTTTNVCRGGVADGSPLQQNCFTTSYQAAASSGSVTGQDPDGFASTGGVSPIDISSTLVPGAVQAKIDLVDTGVLLAASSLYLQTNCTAMGVSNGGEITGNPISQTNPTPQQLAQNFSFNAVPNQVIQFTYDLTEAQAAGQLAITDATIPGTSDQPLTPVQYQGYVAGTSFASSNCLVHTGELLNGQPVCKIYTLECAVGAGSTESGAQCPVSQLPNEKFQDTFDGPAFTLPDIAPIAPGAPTFHQGVGFLMASEGWNGPGCMFDAASGLNNLLCPQNLLTSFTGPGVYSGTGRGTHPNSSFITVAPVPEDLTTVTVAGSQPRGWINKSMAVLNFSSQPPSLPSVSAFVAAPIKSITYGTSSPSSVPMPGAAIATDTVLTNPIACPTPTTPMPALVFAPQPQTITGLSDGYYLVHYFAQDCAGTEELQFTQDGTGSWATSFYTVPLNVDTTAPVVATGPTLSPAPGTNGGITNSYLVNQPVTANYSCSDTLSGVVRCGLSTFAPGTLNTPVITSPVDTSTPGTKTFTVTAIDAAGNQSTSSVQYQVVAATVDLAIVNLAPSSVKRSKPITYNIEALNLGKNTASSVVISDAVAVGSTVASASIEKVTCKWSGCSTSTQGTNCSFTGSVVSCNAATLDPLSPSSIVGLYVKIIVLPTQSVGSTVTNTATVTSANPDSNLRNNTSTVSTKIR